MHYESLRRRISAGESVCGVVGLGYVGLPLAVEMARVGLRVVGFDVSSSVVSALNDGRSHIQDVPSADVVAIRKNGVFEATADISRLPGFDLISI